MSKKTKETDKGDQKQGKDSGKQQEKEKSDNPPPEQEANPREVTPPGPNDLRMNKEAPPGFNPKPSLDLSSESQNPKDSQTPKTQETTPPPKSEEGPRSMVDPLNVTSISTIYPISGNLDNVIPLNEYKFDQSHLVMVKRTPKCWKILLGGLEKPITEGFEESTIWNIVGQDVTRVGVQTSVVIAGMALTGQTSTEAMEKEIARIKQFAAQVQAELAEKVKNVAEERQRSIDELKTTLEEKHEKETQQLQESHAWEKEAIRSEIETSVLDNKDTKMLKVVKKYAQVINTDLQTAQLNYLDQVDSLCSYKDQGECYFRMQHRVSHPIRGKPIADITLPKGK